jgi:hypothetical protein
MLRYIFCFYLLAAQLGTMLYAQEPPVAYFEGTLQFLVELKGPSAGLIMENEPNTKMQMHIKDGSYIINLYGGKYPKTMMFVADSNYEYTVDAANQLAYRFSPFYDRVRENQKEKAVAKPTGRTEEIQGILCEEYQMQHDSTLFTYYVNNDYRVDVSLYPPKPRAKISFLIEGLNGRIPLKTVNKQKGIIVTTTVAKIGPREFDDEQFRIPPDFKVKMRDYRY